MQYLNLNWKSVVLSKSHISVGDNNSMHVSSGAEYQPGTPGGAWSQDDLMVVRAKLWRLYGQEIVELTEYTPCLLCYIQS